MKAAVPVLLQVELRDVQRRDPERGGFHMRGFHAITPETGTSAHYMWTMAANHHPERPDVGELVYEQTALTFYEDKVVIEQQYQNMLRFPGAPQIDIHVGDIKDLLRGHVPNGYAR